MTNSNFVTQDQRIDDLEDVAHLKKRVFELEEKFVELESLIQASSQKHRKHRDQVSSFIGFVPIERKPVKNKNSFCEALGE